VITGLGVLASGGGSNFESLVHACRSGAVPDATVRLLISNKPNVGCLERAVRLGVESRVLDPKGFPDRATYFQTVAHAFMTAGVSVVCLAGFLLKVEPNFLRCFSGRVLNIHPSLLPKFGGLGLYGHHVHEAVLTAGEKESGCSVHVVDEEFDHGPVIAQARVPVLPQDTPDTLAARVLEQEHQLFPKSVAGFLRNFVTTQPSSGPSGHLPPSPSAHPEKGGAKEG